MIQPYHLFPLRRVYALSSSVFSDWNIGYKLYLYFQFRAFNYETVNHKDAITACVYDND